MRVIAGKKRHLLLKALPGDAVRPTEDRTKETLFNCINPYILGCSFLDLFSGTGAIGIEALSRDARTVVMVDNSQDSLQCIRDNLRTTGLTDAARVISRDVLSALSLLESEKQSFDFIFMDPPYDKGLEKQVLTALSSTQLLAEDGWIIVEASGATDFGYADELGYEVFKEKIYKTNKHIFLRRKNV